MLDVSNSLVACGYNLPGDLSVLHNDCANGGINWFVYTAWDDVDTDIDGDALGDYLAGIFPDLAHTWDRNWL